MSRNLIFKIVLALCILVFPLLLGEFSLIFVHHLKYKTGLSSPYSLESHPEIGWYPRKNFSLSYPSKDMAGENFQVNYTSDEKGFRTWGDVYSPKKKILFIGDSFTHARDIDSVKTYYGLFKEEYEVFAFGAGGYGSWQQYLVLERYLNEIKPDLVVWQHHVNDFFDNQFDLDKSLGFSGFIFDRPYPNSTRFEKLPILKSLSKYNSRLASVLIKKYIQWSYLDYDKNIFDEAKQSPALKESLQHFQTSIKMAYGLHPGTKFVHFFVTHDLWFEKKLQEVVKFEYFINEFSKYIGNENSIKVDEMGHWNFKGHERVHKFLAPFIKEKLK
ncbi:MAG: SGNH/GDSL hydrolase family protein [Deltaproteobacteria bacterium]|nr:MAG: SGNH/GDSL hydrolase family protein [Deltaproteobacteria bacterium]